MKVIDSWRKQIDKKIKEFFFSAQGLPLILAFALLGIMFVLFRMKSVELDYRLLTLKKEMESAIQDNKELRAAKARVLSTDSLRAMSKAQNLAAPSSKQIIVIP